MNNYNKFSVTNEETNLEFQPNHGIRLLLMQMSSYCLTMKKIWWYTHSYTREQICGIIFQSEIHLTITSDF